MQWENRHGMEAKPMLSKSQQENTNVCTVSRLYRNILSFISNLVKPYQGNLSKCTPQCFTYHHRPHVRPPVHKLEHEVLSYKNIPF